MNLKSLVTGGAGFIGSHVVDHLIANGHEVIILDDLSGGVVENINPSAIFCKGSITDVTLVNELFKEYNFDYVYHLAAYAAEGLSHFIRKFNYENNLIGSINLINAAVNFNIKCFVFTSSIAVYGQNELPYQEGQFPNPEDPYGIAKFAVEMDLKNAKSMFGLNSIIFRPHNVFGARQNIGDKYRNVVGIFMNQLLKNQPLTVFGNGNQSRAFTAIDDVAPFIANAVNVDSAYNKVFNIGSDNPISIVELIAELNKITGLNAEPNFLTAREEVEHAYANHGEFNRVFERGGITPFSEALSKMWEWVQKNGAKESREFDNIEILKELPAAWRK